MYIVYCKGSIHSSAFMFFLISIRNILPHGSMSYLGSPYFLVLLILINVSVRH